MTDPIRTGPGSTGPGRTDVEITALSVYPVKSMRGIALSEARLTAEGFQHDRRFMVVRSNGRFVTQRDLPRMALIHTALDDEGVITLSRPGYGSIDVPADRLQGETIETKVWGDECQTVDQGQEISNWLGSALESNDGLKLVRMKPGYSRPQSQAELLGEDTTTFFADAAPFLVANESSLEELNRKLETSGHQPVPMNRFRPNIVIQGLEAFEEHQLKRLESADVQLGFCHPCERCVVTTINQDTAEKDPGWQPFKTIRDLNPMPGKKPAPAFGHNAVLSRGEGNRLATGNKLTGHFA